MKHRVSVSSLIGVLVACALVVATLSLAGCIPGITEGPIIYPDITGVITAIDASSDPVSFRVVRTEDTGPGLDAVDVLAARSLKVDTDGMGKPPRSLTDLRVGDIVTVYLNDRVAESYPPKRTAWQISFSGRHQGELPTVPGLASPESTSTP